MCYANVRIVWFCERRPTVLFAKSLLKSSVRDRPYVFGPPGSGSGSVIYCTDPDLDPSINKKKMMKPGFLLFCNFFMTFYLWRMYLQKGISIKIGEKKKYFLLASGGSVMKRAGSGSVIQSSTLRIRIRIRIRTKMSRIRNTALSQGGH